MTSSTAPLRIGVLGAARIARLFVEAVRPSRKVAVTAVASRDADARHRLRARHRHRARPRELRRAVRRPRHRRRLRAAAQQPARGVVDPRRRGRQARAVREAARRLGRARRARCSTPRGRNGVYLVEALSVSRAAADAQAARAARGRRDRPPPARPGVVRLSACRRREHPHGPGSCGRRADGRGVAIRSASCAPSQAPRRARVGDGALGRHGRRPAPRWRRSSSRRPARADLLQLRHRAAPPCLHRRRRGVDRDDLLQRYRPRPFRRCSMCAAAPAGTRRAK